jgi:hypothetical protein
MKGRHYAEEDDEEDEGYVTLAGILPLCCYAFTAVLLCCAGDPVTCQCIFSQVWCWWSGLAAW